MTRAADLSVPELMELHINTLYCCDADGRLRSVNEDGEPPASLFFMGRTPHGNFWRFRYDLSATTVEKLERLCQAEPVTSDLAAPPQNYAAIKAVIAEHLPIHEQKDFRGPAYWIPEGVQPPGTISANVQLISKANVELLQGPFAWMPPLMAEGDVGPVAAAIDDDRAVSLCFCSRRPAEATEAGLETMSAFRGRGYATATTAAWAAEVSRLGCIPLYSTSWDNFASQAVARKLRMVFYADDWSIQ
jgi:hypothetical protein